MQWFILDLNYGTEKVIPWCIKNVFTGSKDSHDQEDRNSWWLHRHIHAADFEAILKSFAIAFSSFFKMKKPSFKLG